MNDLMIGSVVRSRAGHDADGLFTVVGIEGQRLLLADGKRRPLEAPKQKNLRHIRKTNQVLDMSGITTNKKLRETLAKLQEEGGNSLV